MSNQQYRHCGKKLSPAELVEFLTDQHCAMVDDSIMLWLSMSLEDMADVITRAINCSADAPLPSGALAAVLKFRDGQDEFDNWRQS